MSRDYGITPCKVDKTDRFVKIKSVVKKDGDYYYLVCETCGQSTAAYRNVEESVAIWNSKQLPADKQTDQTLSSFTPKSS